MNVVTTIFLSFTISTISIGTICYILKKYLKKHKHNHKDFDIPVKESVLEEALIEDNIANIILYDNFIIELISPNLNKIYKKGNIAIESIVQNRNYCWNHFTLTEDNTQFMVKLSVGLRSHDECTVSIIGGTLTIGHIPHIETPKILMYLSGEYFSSYIDEFVFVDDVVEFNTKNKMLIFNGHPFIKADVRNITCSMETDNIQLRIL